MGSALILMSVWFVPAIDDAAHILGDEGLVADDDPLRLGFGAAGVGHLHRVLDAQDDIGFRCRGLSVPGIEVGEAVGRRLSGPLIGPDQVPYLRHLVQHPLDIVVEAVFDDEDGAFGVVDAEGDVVVSQQVIDGQVDGPDLGAAQPGQDMVVGVVGQDGHAVIFFYPEAGEGVGRLVALVFQLAVGQADVVEYQGRFIGIVIAGAADHVGDDPSVDPVVPVHEKIDIFLADGAVAKLVLFREWFVGHGLALRKE